VCVGFRSAIMVMVMEESKIEHDVNATCSEQRGLLKAQRLTRGHACRRLISGQLHRPVAVGSPAVKGAVDQGGRGIGTWWFGPRC